MNHSIIQRLSFLLYPASQLVMVAVEGVRCRGVGSGNGKQEWKMGQEG